MKRILVTGSGSPGIAGTIYSIRNNPDNQNFIIYSTDVSQNVAGKLLSDFFITIPPAKYEDAYLEKMLSICKKERIDVILPQNTSELFILSKNLKIFEKLNSTVIISDRQALEKANNKYELMKLCKKIGIPTGDFYLVKTKQELFANATLLGWPNKKIVVKPPSSNGMRGVRVIDEFYDRKDSFYNEKPNNLNIKMDDLVNILGIEFDPLIITEYLSGDEYSVDLLRLNKDTWVVPRKRDLIRNGITFNGSVEQNDKIIKFSKQLAEVINLKYCFGFQFKFNDYGEPCILESNPRVQGTMIISTLAGANFIYASIKNALEGSIPDFSNIDWNTKFYRFFGGIGFKSDSTKIII